MNSCTFNKAQVLPSPSAAIAVGEKVYGKFFADDGLIEKEARACFDFFWDMAQTKEGSPAYGLVADRYPSNGVASTASTGFALASLPIAVENGWVDYDAAYERALGTLTTFENLDNYSGFFFHFINMNTGKRAWNCEVSVIDTGLLLTGMLTAGEYFGGEVKEKATQLYANVDWNFYYNEKRKMFYMAYSPEKKYSGAWDVYAEQLLLYPLAAGSPEPKHRVGKEAYDGFTRYTGAYKDNPTIINSWFGSLFTYQYSHCYIDFRDIVDESGVNWFKNSIDASTTAYNFAKDNADKYKSFGVGWGLSACDSFNGYDGLAGSPPSGKGTAGTWEHRVTGTIPPYAAVSSIVFTPELSLEALTNYGEHEKLWGKYGLISGFNLDRGWYSADVIGIDKGDTLLMLANYRSGIVWDLFMRNEYVQNGLEAIGFTEKQ